MLLNLIDFETDPAGMGDPAGDPTAYTALEDPGPPAEPAAEPAPAAPDYISRAELDQLLAEREALAYQQAYDPTYQAADPYAQQPQAQPHLDPFDENFGTSLQQLIRDELAAAQAPMQQMLSPIAQNYQDQQAQAWADQTLQQLGVPDDPAWRDAVLAASAGYERDQYGRQVPPQVALRQGFELVKGFAEAQRQQALTAAQEQAAAQQQHLQTVAGAPNLPAGAGGAEGEPEPTNVRDAVRAAYERVTAGNGTAA